MARVRQRGTKPELLVRSLLHSLGLRFSVNGPLNKKLPSRPDIVMPRWKTAVLVHGCFWHRHPDCKMATTPRTRQAFWNAKFTANMARDIVQRRALQELGWRVVTIWECETRRPRKLARRLKRLFKIPAARSIGTCNRMSSTAVRRFQANSLQAIGRPRRR